jgi:hypothetical protein
VPLWLLHHDAQNPNLHQTVHALAGVHAAGLDIVLFFMGFGGSLFFALLWRSGFVPKTLAGAGLLTYLVMIVVPVVGLMRPEISPNTKMIFFAPGGVFELVFGVWLLVRGIKQTAVTEAS